jgi:hypothetical protein
MATAGAPPPSPTPPTTPAKPAGFSLADYATAKHLPLEFLHECGVTECSVSKAPAVRIPYYSTDGVEVAVRLRVAPGRYGHRWKTGTKTTLFGWNRLHDAQQEGEVTLVEGESDALTLWHNKIPALGYPGAATWKPAWDTALDGIAKIYLLIEPDRGGAAVLGWLRKRPWRDRVRIVHLVGAKDVNALYAADKLDFKLKFLAALDRAEPYATVEATLRATEDTADAALAREALALAGPVLADPLLFWRIAQAIQARGYAGDLRPALLAYLGITSRLLEKPMNLAFVAQSASGKNAAINAALPFFPPDATYVLSAGSERALVYADEDFVHRTVVVEEADTIPEDGPAASAVRAIGEAHLMRYVVVERDEQTGRWGTRTIERPGPTNLMTTSVRSLGEQLGTRHLEVTISDADEQTREIMHVHADRAMGDEPPDPDPSLLAVQTWLGIAGTWSVVVPYARRLSAAVSSKEVRMRRDFNQLLTAIKSVALLYQKQRNRTATGRIIATADDYRLAREVLRPVFAATVAGGATPAIRETVEAIGRDEQVARAELVVRLGVAARTVRWRVQKCKEGGWLEEDEQKRLLRRGTPLPDITTALPDPDDVCGNSATPNGEDEGEDPPTFRPTNGRGSHPHRTAKGGGPHPHPPWKSLPSCRPAPVAHRPCSRIPTAGPGASTICRKCHERHAGRRGQHLPRQPGGGVPGLRLGDLAPGGRPGSLRALSPETRRPDAPRRHPAGRVCGTPAA